MDALTAYKQANQPCTHDLVIQHAPMVKRIVYHMRAKLPDTISLDDMIQTGLVGLLEAAKQYDATKGASFETYANIRIRGHILDEIRKNDWVPRSVYRNARKVSHAVKQVEQRLGRDASDTEIAEELNLTSNEYAHLLKESTCIQVLHFDDLGIDQDYVGQDIDSEQPLTTVLKNDFNEKLLEIIDGLPEKEKLVLSLYYEQELNLKEIGKVINVSESRVSQILSQATLRIRARLEG
ncbi:RNA polymerase sigma factor FliA [Legionella sp. W05-934-2]|jgi:RNA polymerase sigma factor for flagellar operon FliA|uniref:RNA polymerase sigma factor FliA n=1 Tax=Legionella sp. W05-934-2 TaxID=1198649 RepID=UPI003461F15B